ncbi:VOC family protein [uncultured Phenylobacterium sp.]|uniref:VOC family protein n=1 Tax=uncultured Phenylobacterium sp. TaxID=349273 RepID=UPI0025DEC222|nr:VOC family protein [uncultured Phenylobacterium sp.]
MTTQTLDRRLTDAPALAALDTKLEVLLLPVSNVHRAADFYQQLGWRLDVDHREGDARIVHFTPPGSAASVMFGTGLSPSAPGSAQLTFLAVSDIVAARAGLLAKGIDVSEVFHDRNGGYRFDPDARQVGPDPDRRSYASFATFSDPDGNSWLLQEVTTRFPGRIDSGVTSFGSAADLAGALRRAANAHGAHEARNGGGYDTNWPDWYASYLAAEQSGAPLPL